MSKTVQLSHAEIKEKLIEMLDFLNQFFCNHNLKYSIMSGTMLGAAYCGLPCALGLYGPGTACWYGVPRLAGSGKKRG